MIRCMTDVCARYSHPLEGSITRAGDLLRMLFLAPGKPVQGETTKRDIVKLEVRAITRATKIPRPVINAATRIATAHAGTFRQRSPKVAAGAIVCTAILATGGPKTCHLQTVAHHAHTTYPTTASSIKRACQKLGDPLPVKLLRAGSYLRALLLDGPPGSHGVHHGLPSPPAQEGPPAVAMQEGPPPNASPAPA